MLDKTMRWVCALLKDHRCLTITDMQGKMTAHFSQNAGGVTMHYKSRCEKSALDRFLNNLQKNIKKSLVHEVRQKSNISEHRIRFYFTK